MPTQPFASLLVRDVMTRDVVTAGEDETLSDVLGRMREASIHEIPVVGRHDVLLGMVSYSQLLRRRSLPLTAKVAHLLVRTPEVRETDDVSSVAEVLMSSGYRAMPVTEKGTLRGIVSRTDIVRAMKEADNLAKARVTEIMTPEPETIGDSDSMSRARQLLLRLDERAIPVVDGNGKLVGVVGIKDFSDYLWKPRQKEKKGEHVGEKTPQEVEVKSLMRSPPVTVDPTASVADAARLMAEYDISSVVVVREEKPIGIVTQVDLLGLIASARRRDEIYVQLSGLGEEDGWAMDNMYDVIQKGIRRISDIVHPTMLNVHVAKHEESVARSKYSLRARLAVDRGLYHAWDWDWDLLRATDKVMDQLERRVKKDKEIRVQGRRGRNKES